MEEKEDDLGMALPGLLLPTKNNDMVSSEKKFNIIIQNRQLKHDNGMAYIESTLDCTFRIGTFNFSGE